MQKYDKVARTINMTKVTAMVFDDKTNKALEIKTLFNNKLKVPQVMKKLKEEGHNPIKVLSLEYMKEFMEMDLDTFVKYAKRVEE